MNLYVAVVFDEAQLPELVHEMTDARARRADDRARFAQSPGGTAACRMRKRGQLAVWQLRKGAALVALSPPHFSIQIKVAFIRLCDFSGFLGGDE